MEFSRQEHWRGLPFPSPGWGVGGIFLNQGSNLGLLHCRQILHHLSHQATLKRRLFLLQRMLPPTVRCDLTSRLWSPRSGPALFGFWGRNKCEAGQGCPSQVMLHDNSFCELTGSSCHMSLQHPHLPPWRQLLSSKPISTLSRLFLGEKYGRRSPWRFD